MKDLFGKESEPPKKVSEKKKRNWENRFQWWSDTEAQDGTTSHGKCGYGSMCDYCEDSSYGRPCVRALNDMIKRKGIKINYDKDEFNKVWGGIFDKL